MRLDRDGPDDPRADDHANAVRDQSDDRAQRVRERALPNGEPEQNDVAGHHRGEHVESKQGDRVDRTRGECQSDQEQVGAAELTHGSAGRELADDVGKYREIAKDPRR